jgi:hypothetical protein
MDLNEYHGIIINQSQKNKSIFKKLKIIGKKKVFFGLVVLFKISVNKENLNDIIKSIQENMASNLFILKQEYYAHFYRKNELIIVFKNRVFYVTTDKNTWKEAIDYGKSLNIIEKQLDFTPNKIEDEKY